jgi:tRNA uridine 5-carbamoylmethylation protein Kti12
MEEGRGRHMKSATAHGKKRVIVLRGIPGSGKSYYAKKLIAKHVLEQSLVSVPEQSSVSGAVVVVSADSFFGVDEDYKKNFSPTKLTDAHNHCFWLFLDALRDDDVGLVIVDNTNSTAMEISPYMLAAGALGHDATVHQIECDPEVAYGRNQHGVPRDTVHRMAARVRGEWLPPWWEIKTVFPGEEK